MSEQEHDAYELFRRAILYRDAEAWASIHERYRSLLISWVAHRSRATLEWPDDIADQALARAWVALTPERFTEFSSLARLLSYLRTCVVTTAIDSARAQACHERIPQRLYAGTVATPEQLVLAGLDQSALWRTALDITVTAAERIALIESFAYGLPPRDIRNRHPQLFPDVEAVYSVKRNLLARLQRNRDVIQLGQELAAA
jgi:DNA-directed RNA polymerase specialized sigma24 family protein